MSRGPWFREVIYDPKVVQRATQLQRLALWRDASWCRLAQPREGTTSGRPSSTYKNVTEEMEHFTEVNSGRTRDSGLVHQQQVPPSPRVFSVCQPWAWHHWRASNSHWDSFYTPWNQGLLFHFYFTGERGLLGSLWTGRREKCNCLLL